MQGLGARCPADIARNLSCPSKESLVVHSPSRRPCCHGPRQRTKLVIGRWTSCSGSEPDTAPAEPGWSCSVVIFFSGTSLLCWLQHANALRFVLALAQSCHWNCELKRKMRGQQSHRSLGRWGGKELNWLLLAWVLSLTKEDFCNRLEAC